MVVVYSIRGNTYTVSQCDISNVDSDYELVKDLVDDIPEEVYKENMIKSIECSLAYRVADSSGKVGFMYTYIEGNIGYGSAILNRGPVAGFVCLLKELFNNYPSHKILLMPHKGNITYLKSMTIGYSIRNHHNKQEPLVIKVDDMYTKFKELYYKLGGK